MYIEHTLPHCSVPPFPLLKTPLFFPPVSLFFCLCCWSCSGLMYRLLCAGCFWTAVVCSGFRQLRHAQNNFTALSPAHDILVSPFPWDFLDLGRGDVDGLLSAECLTHISHLFLVLCLVVSLCINYYLLQKEPYLIKTKSITNLWAQTNI